MSGAIHRSHESKKRVRSATAFGQCNRNRLLRQSKVLFAHLTPGPLMGVGDLGANVEWRKLAGFTLFRPGWPGQVIGPHAGSCARTANGRVPHEQRSMSFGICSVRSTHLCQSTALSLRESSKAV